MLSSLIGGSDWLDILVVGDSNAAYSDATGARGYSGGFYDALLDTSGFNVKEFATGLGEPSASTVSYPTNGSTGENGTGAFAAEAATASGATWGSATGFAGQPISSVFYRGNSGYELRFPGTGVTKDASYLDTTSSNGAYNSTAYWLNKDTTNYPNALNSDHAATFAVHYAVLANQTSARMQGWVYTAGPTTTIAGNSGWTSVANSTGSIVTGTLKYAYGASTRTKLYGLYSLSGTNGKLAVLWRSYYRTAQPGFSLTTLQCYSGGTTTQIANSLDETNGCKRSTLKTYLKYLVDRQSECGGSGKVLVFCNMGVNDSSASLPASNYSTQAQTIVSQFTTAWSELGYSSNKLGIVLTVSHGFTTGSAFDPSGTYSSLAAAFAGRQDVTVVDINSLYPASALSAQSLYTAPSGTGSSSGSAHLAKGGYKAISRSIIDKVANSTGLGALAL